MNTPIYDDLCARRKRPRLEGAEPVDTAPIDRGQLALELDACAFFADGTRHGELVPLADFTRHRISKALRDASLHLTAPVRMADVDADPGVILVAKERARHIEHEGYSPDGDVGRVRELCDAAICYLEVAVLGADAWHHPDGSYAPPGGWPWPPQYWKPQSDRLRNLVKAGALVVAAITAERRSS